jgi:hypothetical protein
MHGTHKNGIYPQMIRADRGLNRKERPPSAVNLLRRTGIGRKRTSNFGFRHSVFLLISDFGFVHCSDAPTISPPLRHSNTPALT